MARLLATREHTRQELSAFLRESSGLVNNGETFFGTPTDHDVMWGRPQKLGIAIEMSPQCLEVRTEKIMREELLEAREK